MRLHRLVRHLAEMSQRPSWAVLLVLLCWSIASAATDTRTRTGSAKMLFCADGSIGMRPNPLPPEYETEFAVAVVEIDSPMDVSDAAVSNFVLFDQAAKRTYLKRVVKVENVDAITRDADGSYHYLDSNALGARLWNGTLPTRRSEFACASPSRPPARISGHAAGSPSVHT